jgi:hypothetical protein
MGPQEQAAPQGQGRGQVHSTPQGHVYSVFICSPLAGLLRPTLLLTNERRRYYSFGRQKEFKLEFHPWRPMKNGQRRRWKRPMATEMAI